MEIISHYCYKEIRIFIASIFVEQDLLQSAVLVAYGKKASPPDAQLPTWEREFSLKKDAVFAFLTRSVAF